MNNPTPPPLPNAPVDESVPPTDPSPAPAPEEAKRQRMAQDFALGANQRHLRLPGGLQKQR
jgi:hypothetical protein